MKFLNKIDGADKLITDANNRLVKDTDISNWNNKSDKGHKHTKSEITDFPTSLPANGGNADTVGGFTVGTNVPANAKFTDTITTINGKTGVITKADIVALGIPAQDTNTTYSEISTAEIDAGTSSTLRTITARRLKYLLDKIVALFPTKTSELTNDSGFLTTNDLVPNISIGKSKPTDGSLIWYEEI